MIRFIMWLTYIGLMVLFFVYSDNEWKYLLSFGGGMYMGAFITVERIAALSRPSFAEHDRQVGRIMAICLGMKP